MDLGSELNFRIFFIERVKSMHLDSHHIALGPYWLHNLVLK
jgi:hypothetical protein